MEAGGLRQCQIRPACARQDNLFCKKYLLEVGPSDPMEAGGLRRWHIRPACARQDNLFCKKYLLEVGPSDLIEAGGLRRCQIRPACARLGVCLVFFRIGPDIFHGPISGCAP